MPRTVPGASTRPTARRALDRRFETLRPLTKSATAPRGRWIRAIREPLDMSPAERAARIGNTDTAVWKLEQSEREGRAGLDTLQRAAAALDCDLVYAFVPRKPLEE